MEITVHRYKIRPGLEYKDIPACFPDGSYKTSLTDNFDIEFAPEIIRKSNYERNDSNSDLYWFWVTDKRYLYDNDDYLDLIDNWCRTGYITTVDDKEQLALIQAYNNLLDNLTWLIRDKSLEKVLTYNPKEEELPRMSVYELNQQAYKNVKPMNKEKIKNAVFDILDYMEKHIDCKYYMLLCRELNDYTLFNKINVSSFQTSARTVIEIASSRGELLDVRPNEEMGYIEFWVKHNSDNEPHMYLFFNAADFVIEC